MRRRVAAILAAILARHMQQEAADQGTPLDAPAPLIDPRRAHAPNAPLMTRQRRLTSINGSTHGRIARTTGFAGMRGESVRRPTSAPASAPSCTNDEVPPHGGEGQAAAAGFDGPDVEVMPPQGGHTGLGYPNHALFCGDQLQVAESTVGRGGALGVLPVRRCTGLRKPIPKSRSWRPSASIYILSTSACHERGPSGLKAEHIKYLQNVRW